MPTYFLGVIEPQGDEVPGPEILGPIMKAVDALTEEMKAEGIWAAAGGLEAPSSARTIRPSGETRLVFDGPFVETKEHLGGFTAIEVEDMDAALHWGRRLSEATTLPIEVREFRGPLMK